MDGLTRYNSRLCAFERYDKQEPKHNPSFALAQGHTLRH